MRHAIRWLPLAALAAFALLSGRPAGAQNASAVSSGVALLDFNRPPDFKVGDWVRYNVWGTATGADSVEYVLTLLVAGEEVFWGDSCFWLEAWTEAPGQPLVGMATLVSYQAYRDSGAASRAGFYSRKSIMNFEEDGTPIEEIVLQARSVLQLRHLPGADRPDTTIALGRDTAVTALGVLDCDKDMRRWLRFRTIPKGDSTTVNESRQDRTQWHHRDIPLTNLAREVGAQEEWMRTWRSIRPRESAPNQLIARADNEMRLIGQGHGLEARFIPKAVRSTLAQQAAAAKKAAAAKGTSGARGTTAAKGGAGSKPPAGR